MLAGCLAADARAGSANSGNLSAARNVNRNGNLAPFENALKKPEAIAFKTVLRAVSDGSKANPTMLKTLAHLGEGVYLFLALKALGVGEKDAGILCLESGMLYEKNPVYKARIRCFLVDIYYNQGEYDRVLALTKSGAETEQQVGTKTAKELPLSPKEKLYRARALRDTKAYGEALSAWTELQKLKLADVSALEIEEALIEALAGTDIAAHAKLIREKLIGLLTSARSIALTQALERLLGFSDFFPDTEISKQILIRVFVGRKDYGSAVRLFKNYALSAGQGTLKKPAVEKIDTEPTIEPEGSSGMNAGNAAPGAGLGNSFGNSAVPGESVLGNKVSAVPGSVGAVPGVNLGDSGVELGGGQVSGGGQILKSDPTPAPEPTLENLHNLFEQFTYTTQADISLAYRYSDANAGHRLFSFLFERSANKQVKFLSAYNMGLIERDKKNIETAVSWFSRAEQNSFSPDTDNQAVWYQIDLLADREPSKALTKLTSILRRTNNPDYFADVIERMSRNALVEMNGSMLMRIDALVFTYGSGACKARMAYIAARAAQTGIITQKHLNGALPKTSLASFIDQRLRWVQSQNSELWFKMLAAYRLELALVPESWRTINDNVQSTVQGGQAGVQSGQQGIQQIQSDTISEKSKAQNEQTGMQSGQAGTPAQLKAPEQWDTPGTNYTIFTAVENHRSDMKYEEAQFAMYFSQLMRWELQVHVIDELKQYPVQAQKTINNVRALADYLYKKGEYNLAIRVINELFGYSGYSMQEFDRKIYWPTAFPDEIQRALEPRNLNKWIYYALIRSESLFKPDAVSKSGASGLGQFMPATAADVAKRLKMETYDLTKPADNLFMSAYYFQALVNQFDGQVLPAIWAYNAGPNRYLQWKKQFGSLPFDLFMEAIPFAETRQYGKNIGRASILYAAIHEKTDGKALLAFYLGEKTLK